MNGLLHPFSLARRWAAAWAEGDREQARALKRVGAFFAAMLLMTLIARGTAGATMPVVQAAHASAGSLTQTIRVTGRIAPEGGVVLCAPEGLLIRQVLIQPGMTLAVGDPIALLDSAAVDTALADKNAEIQQLKAKLTALQTKQTPDSSAVETARLALGIAQENYDAAADDADEAEKRHLKQALEQAQLACDQADRSYSEAAQAATLAAGENAAAATSVKNQIAGDETSAKALKAIQAADYRLLADAAGTVQETPLAAGSLTGACAATLWDADSVLHFVCTLTQQQAKDVSTGMTVNITQGSHNAKAAVSALSQPDADGNITVAAPLEPGSLQNGEASAEITLCVAQYPQIVPIAAVHMDGRGSFVYRIEQQNTVLGLQNVLVRVPVTVLAQNQTSAALESSLAAADTVVTSAEKPLTNGCRVRVET